MPALEQGPHHRSSNAVGDALEAPSRQLILDTAARLFRQEGYAATSLRDIAGECGMKAGSLYHHFASKDEIIGEVLRIGVERVFDEVRRAVTALPPDADARTLLHTALRAHLAALLELHDYTSANVRIFGQVPAGVRARHIATRDAYERYWAGLLRRCARSGGWNPRRKLGLTRLFLINALNGSLEWFSDGRSTVEQLAHELSELVLDGLNARPVAHEAGPAPTAGARASRPTTARPTTASATTASATTKSAATKSATTKSATTKSATTSRSTTARRAPTRTGSAEAPTPTKNA